jgi:ABC-type multidrug transport system ATPase subunit
MMHSRQSQNKPLVHLIDISVGYRSLLCTNIRLQNVTVSLFHDEIVAIIGANGAGKSTLLKTIAGFLKPIKGQCLVNAQQIGYVGEHAQVPPFLTPYRYLKYLLDLSHKNTQTIDPFLENIGLKDYRDEPLGSFSKGMRQRFMVAQALINNPSLIVLDEPFSGLDTQSTACIHSVVFEQKRKNSTIVYTTHEQPVAQTTKIIVLANKTIDTIIVPSPEQQDSFFTKNFA